MRDFLGGSEVENLPSNAGGLGVDPAWRTKIPQASGQLSLGTQPQRRPVSQGKSLHATIGPIKKRPSAAPPAPKKKNYRNKREIFS